MIHREGYVILLIAFIFLSALGWISSYYIQIPWIKWGVWAVLFVMFILVLQFFRNPSRHTVKNPEHIIAPADGEIVVIEKTTENEYFKDERIQISIFMSPLNVHVNRNPISGKIDFYRYHPGKYLVAWHPKSSELNERTTVVIEDEKGRKVLFRQIAGAVARRIKCYLEESQTVEQGKEMGFIKFGSRVDVFVPLDAQINVKIGDKPRGGETVLATF
jgi:phosphatidylserine decarboxylase